MINLSTRRNFVIGTRKYKNRISRYKASEEGLVREINHLNEEIIARNRQIEALQAQVSSLQTQLAEAQALAQLRANIITYKNNYIHTLQDILDNNGIPYPPEPIYPTT